MPSILVDAHLDLAYNAVVLHRDLRRPVAEIRAQETLQPPPGEYTGTCLVSLPALLAGRFAVVGGSLFVAPAVGSWPNEPVVYHTPDEAYAQALAQLDYYRRLTAEDERVTLLRREADLDAVLTAWEQGTPRLGLFVVLEGADPIRDPGELGEWVERGLRGVGLTWAAGTRYGGGNQAPGPLTDLGRQLLHRMAEYNLLLDLSHLWEEAAFAALDGYPGPVVASHANPRAFVDSPRMLADALIRRLAEHDGVVGIIPFNRMLQAGWTPREPRLPLARVVEAVDYVCQLVGDATHVGIGSDFDGGFGVESVPEGIETSADLGQLGPLLAARGYAPTEVEAILGGNWLREMRRALGE